MNITFALGRSVAQLDCGIRWTRNREVVGENLDNTIRIFTWMSRRRQSKRLSIKHLKRKAKKRTKNANKKWFNDYATFYWFLPYRYHKRTYMSAAPFVLSATLSRPPMTFETKVASELNISLPLSFHPIGICIHIYIYITIHIYIFICIYK